MNSLGSKDIPEDYIDTETSRLVLRLHFSRIYERKRYQGKLTSHFDEARDATASCFKTEIAMAQCHRKTCSEIAQHEKITL